jgi:hypothetical protein
MDVGNCQQNTTRSKLTVLNANNAKLLWLQTTQLENSELQFPVMMVNLTTGAQKHISNSIKTAFNYIQQLRSTSQIILSKSLLIKPNKLAKTNWNDSSKRKSKNPK